MNVFILDVVIIVIALSILFTTVQKNHKIHLRRIVCALIAFGASFWVLSFQKDLVIGFITSLNLSSYLTFVPNEFMTPAVTQVVGYGVILLGATIVYILLLLICKMFSQEGRRYKRDVTYSPVYRPVLSFVAGLLKVVLFVYMSALFVYVCSDLFVGYDLNNSIIYPLLNNNGLILWAKELKEIALAILG